MHCQQEQCQPHHHCTHRSQAHEDDIHISSPAKWCIIPSPILFVGCSPPTTTKRKLTYCPLLFGIGLVNLAITGIISSGIIIHLPSFFNEFNTLLEKGQLHSCVLYTHCLSTPPHSHQNCTFDTFCFVSQDWIAPVDSSLPIGCILSLTSTRLLMG